MAVPLPPALTLNLTPANVPTIASSLTLCKMPREGLACLPVSLSPTTDGMTFYNNFSLNLNVGGPAEPLSQISSCIVDASNSSCDITISCPDTGYKRTVSAGDTETIPIYTSVTPPQVYVNFDIAKASTADVANIFLLNQFIPDYTPLQIIKAVEYAYSGHLTLLDPPFGVSKNGPLFINPYLTSTDVDADSFPSTVIGSTFTLNNIQIFGIILSTETQLYNLLVQLYDGAGNFIRTMWKIPFIGTTAQQVLTLLDKDNLDTLIIDNEGFIGEIVLDIDTMDNIEDFFFTINFGGDGLG